MSNVSPILDASGKPFLKASKPAARHELAEVAGRPIRARYDAAQDWDQTKHHWANADTYDADSSNSREVRSKLVPRSRYETWNNGYSDGIAQTSATDLVGVGPQLRMQTGSKGFNRMVELRWYEWCKAVQFRRKLWTMAHSKHVDGESIAVMRRNPRVRHDIKLDVVLYETEQCQTPYLPFDQPGYIDGIRFDEFGNAIVYDILHQHPGTNRSMTLDPVPEEVPADRVLHWFKLRRPNQHRGIPETTSTLNLGASARRWRESTLSHAELIAKLTVLLKSLANPSEEDADNVAALSTLELLTGMMVNLPNSVEPVQLDAKQPAQTYSMFHKALINEQARPKSMPYNKAACDSSDYNYASGRLDHQTYYAALDCEREDGNDLVLDPLFTLWFDFAVMRYGWLGGNPETIGYGARAHLWDWPKHRVADVESEANANQTRLKSGQVFLHTLYTDGGTDFEDEIEKGAATFGIKPEEMRKRLLDVILPEPKQEAKPPARDIEALAFYLANRGSLNGHSNGHANGAHVNGN